MFSSSANYFISFTSNKFCFNFAMATVSGPGTVGNIINVSLCKKCGIKHEHPFRAKCEWNKPVVKDENKDMVKDIFFIFIKSLFSVT